MQPAIAFAIREQLYEVLILSVISKHVYYWCLFPSFAEGINHVLQIAVQNVTSAKEIKLNKKGRRGIEYIPVRYDKCILL